MMILIQVRGVYEKIFLLNSTGPSRPFGFKYFYLKGTKNMPAAQHSPLIPILFQLNTRKYETCILLIQVNATFICTMQFMGKNL